MLTRKGTNLPSDENISNSFKNLPVMSSDAAHMSAAARLMHSFRYGETGEMRNGADTTIKPFPMIAS